MSDEFPVVCPSVICKFLGVLLQGFSMVLWEADLVDAARVDRYVRGASCDNDAAAALSGFKRYPLWMWRNKAVAEFVEWTRQHKE